MNQYNDKGQRHGQWEDYYFNGKLAWRSNYSNHRLCGYFELYNIVGKLIKKQFHL